MREVITTNQAPAPIGPFSQGIRAGGFIFVSGHVGIDPQTRTLVEGGVREQTERTIRNLQAVLEASGASLQSVVRCAVYLRNMSDFAAMNEVYATFFSSQPPARTTIEVSRLPVDALVEIDAIAVV